MNLKLEPIVALCMLGMTAAFALSCTTTHTASRSADKADNPPAHVVTVYQAEG